jgi:hypothetical protein
MEEVMTDALSYQINGVPDFDQRWAALPNKGAMYCAPTAAMNWVYYLAKHGWPLAPFFALGNDTDAFHIEQNLLKMAGNMQTDPITGTGGNDTVNGLSDWLEDRGVPAVVVSGSTFGAGNVTLADLFAISMGGGLVIPINGWYRKEDGNLKRRGGHVTSLIRLDINGLDANIWVRDPADDAANLNTQSPRATRMDQLKQGKHNLDGNMVTALRWGNWGVGTGTTRIMDGYIAIFPIFALTNPTAKVILVHHANFQNGGMETRKITLPFDGELVDLAIHPSLPRASMIARGANDIWTLDLTKDTWSKTASVPSAARLTYGGRDRMLFVVKGNEILSFDGTTGLALSKLDVGAGIDAVSYDHQNDRLIVATQSTGRLLAVSPELKVVGNTEAPKLPGVGRLALSASAHDGTIVLSREGVREVATLRWHATGAPVAGTFQLITEAHTAAGHVDRKGRMFAVEHGKIATFDTDGNPVTGSPLKGLPAGPLLKVARSSNNFDPVRSQLKEWRN